MVHEGDPYPIDITPLRHAMRIHQQSAAEIKLKHVARGGFLELLESTKLTTFLRWIRNNGLMIHYQELDPLYWSIADIIDSIVGNMGNSILALHHADLKSNLTAVLRRNLDATIRVFYQHGYPSLLPEWRVPFLEDLIDLLESEHALPEFDHYMLKGVLQAGRDLDSLAFIEDNTPNVLIDNLAIWYVDRVALFKNAQHVFDAEKSIHNLLVGMAMTAGGLPITNYRFADSKVEMGIQLSDIVVGLLGKMYTYFIETPSAEVAMTRSILHGTSLLNAELLRDLIAASDQSNIAFLHHIASQPDIEKLDIFLRFQDGRHAG